MYDIVNTDPRNEQKPTLASLGVDLDTLSSDDRRAVEWLYRVVTHPPSHIRGGRLTAYAAIVLADSPYPVSADLFDADALEYLQRMSVQHYAQKESDESHRVSIVVFPPAQLYRPGTLDFCADAPHLARTDTWEALARFLSVSKPGDPVRFPAPDIAKRARGAWVPGRYRVTHGHAGLARHLIDTSLLILDCDSGDPHAVAKVLGRYDTIIHTTYKHRADAPRCRIVMRLREPCTDPQTYKMGLDALSRMLGERGFTVPAKDSTLGRLAYLPMHQPDVTPIFVANKGKALDLETLADAERQRQRQLTPKSKGSCTQIGERKSEAYIAAVVQRLTTEIANAPRGTRHTARVRAAKRLGDPDIGFRPEETLALLYPVARAHDDDAPENEIRNDLTCGGVR